MPDSEFKNRNIFKVCTEKMIKFAGRRKMEASQRLNIDGES